MIRHALPSPPPGAATLRGRAALVPWSRDGAGSASANPPLDPINGRKPRHCGPSTPPLAQPRPHLRSRSPSRKAKSP
jgi:hypothetical protein